MKLTLKRNGIACYEKIFEYSAPAEAAAETVISDTMPDVERILRAEGTVVIRSKEARDGRVTVEGGVAVSVIYAPEGESGARQVSAALPLSVDVDAPGVTPDSAPVACMELVNVEAKTLNPRKLLIRAVVMIKAICYDKTETGFVCGVDCGDGEDAETLVRAVSLSPVVCVTEKTFAVTDEYHAPAGAPRPGELLWHMTELTEADTRAVGSKIVLNGKARVSFLYRAEDTGRLASAVLECPYSQVIDTETELNSPECQVSAILTAEYVEIGIVSDGERGLNVELHLVAQIVCTDRVETEILGDCYSNSVELKTEICEKQTPLFSRRTQLSASLNDRYETPEASEVIQTGCWAGPAVWQDGQLCCDAHIAVVCAGEDGSVSSMQRRAAVSAPCPLGNGESVRGASARCAEAYAVPCPGGVEFRARIDFCASVYGSETVRQVTGLSEDEERERVPLASLTVIRAGSDDSLWELGKKYHSTARLISEVNSLADGDGLAGKVLLIPAVK